MATLVVTPNKTSYVVGEPIVVTVAVDGAFTGETALVDVTAQVLVDGEPVDGTVQIEVVDPAAEVEYQSVMDSTGQVYTQDEVDPSRFTGVAVLPPAPAE